MESFLSVLIGTYAIMVLAEFGDKTNLIALSLMTQTKHKFRVAVWATVGIGLSTIVSVMIGVYIGNNFPLDPIRYIAALIFIILGVFSFREEEEEMEIEAEDEKDTKSENVPFYKPIYLVALAEFGDKSQLFAISAAASTSAAAVFVGSILGMATIMFATAAFGQVLFEKIHPELLEKIAASLFIVAGLWIAIATFLGI